MVLYNVTISIDPNVHEEWLDWMRTKHIPEVLETGCFLESRISRVHGEEEGGLTFAVMYLAPSQEIYDKYQNEFAPALQQEHSDKFGGKFAAFRTTLSVIEEFKKI
ncbi:MAG: DUF4286 family protein [Flavobacteriia bacterium]|nr:DUF4286 family protein [Flavobacteriia bacterium]